MSELWVDRARIGKFVTINMNHKFLRYLTRPTATTCLQFVTSRWNGSSSAERKFQESQFVYTEIYMGNVSWWYLPTVRKIMINLFIVYSRVSTARSCCVIALNSEWRRIEDRTKPQARLESLCFSNLRSLLLAFLVGNFHSSAGDDRIPFTWKSCFPPYKKIEHLTHPIDERDCDHWHSIEFSEISICIDWPWTQQKTEKNAGKKINDHDQLDECSFFNIVQQLSIQHIYSDDFCSSIYADYSDSLASSHSKIVESILTHILFNFQ